MLPPSSRTGAWRTPHHRVTPTADLSGLDIVKTLQYCLTSLYVRARMVSSGSNAGEATWAFETVFEIPRNGKRPKRPTASAVAKRVQEEIHGPPRRQIRHHHRRRQRHRARGVAPVQQGRRETDRGRPQGSRHG